MTPEQQCELAGIAHSYTSAMQSLQQSAQALCEQLKQTLLPFSAQSHISMRLFNVAAALQDNLEEQHKGGLQVVRQVCLQVTAAVTIRMHIALLQLAANIHSLAGGMKRVLTTHVHV